jgi:hypothetical protein
MDHAEHGGKKDAEKENLKADEAKGNNNEQSLFKGASFYLVHSGNSISFEPGKGKKKRTGGLLFSICKQSAILKP